MTLEIAINNFKMKAMAYQITEQKNAAKDMIQIAAWLEELKQYRMRDEVKK